MVYQQGIRHQHSHVQGNVKEDDAAWLGSLALRIFESKLEDANPQEQTSSQDFSTRGLRLELQDKASPAAHSLFVLHHLQNALERK